MLFAVAVRHGSDAWLLTVAFGLVLVNIECNLPGYWFATVPKVVSLKLVGGVSASPLCCGQHLLPQQGHQAHALHQVMCFHGVWNNSCCRVGGSWWLAPAPFPLPSDFGEGKGK